MTLPLWTYALGWTLLHSLWQGVLLHLLYLLVRRSLSPAQAAARYLLALGSLGALALSAGCTLWQLWPAPTTAATAVPLATPADLPILASAPAPSQWHLLEGGLPWLSLAWLGGILFLSVRWGHSYLLAQGLRRRGVQPVPAAWQAQLAELQTRMGLRRPVRLRLSTHVDGPLTLGFWRPVILIPVSMVSGLSPAQWEAILLHELAHIRRADYLINLCQSLLELLFFYHPVTWFLSREITREREACCDDLAVAACGDAVGYAKALTRLHRLRFHPQSPFAMNLQSQPGAFTHRIQRLFSNPPATQRHRLTPLLSLLLLLGLTALVWRPESRAADRVPQQSPLVEWVSPAAGEPFVLQIDGSYTRAQVADLQAQLAAKGYRLHLTQAVYDAQDRLTALSGTLHFPDQGGASFTTDELGQPGTAILIQRSAEGGVTVDIRGPVPSDDRGTPAEAPLPPGAIYVIDGRMVTQAELAALAPEQIDHMEVLKGDCALEAYGEVAREGAVVIYSRPGAAPEAPLTAQPAPRYWLDGVLSTQAEMEALAPEAILSVDVRKLPDTDAPPAVYVFTKAGQARGIAPPAAMKPMALQATPNPAQDRVTIAFTLDQPGRVRLRAYDSAGQAVAQIAEVDLPAGRQVLEWTIGGLPAGTYLIQAEGPQQAGSLRVVLNPR